MGPDTLICPESSFYLAAGNYFTSFIWQDGRSDSLFEVQDTGVYWLEAVDRCGVVQRDSIIVAYEDVPKFDFGFDTLWICENETYQLVIPPIYDSYKWYQYYVGFGWIGDGIQGSTNIFNYWASPFFPSVAGEGITALGCKWRDTLDIVLFPIYPPSNAEAFVCQGDSLLLGSQYYHPGDTDTATLQTIHGCDSLVIYTVLPLDTFYLETDTSACEGEAFSIVGQSILAGSQQAISYTSQQGCDSTVLFRVAALSHTEGMQDTTICPGTSVLVFGEEETEADTYLGHFTAANGCDSTHYFTINLFEKIQIEVATSPTCEGKEEGTALAQVSSGQPPYHLVWGNGTEGDSTLQNLAVGNYSLTVTDANGCQQIAFFDIPNYPLTEVALKCEPRLYAPTAFSPNGDGVNDFFTFYSNNKVLEIKLLQVYDVWGERVYVGKNLPLGMESAEGGWDGMFRGQPMNPGVFVWKASFRYKEESLGWVRGDVVLLR